MAISCGGPPHQSSGPILGRALLVASTSTTQFIKHALGIKGKSSRSEAYIAGRTDIKKATETVLGHTRRNLLDFFVADRLGSILTVASTMHISCRVAPS